MGLIEEGTPYIFWDLKWHPICGQYFWDNNIGATLICNKLGYNSGVVSRMYGEKYSTDAFKIGMCKINDNLTNCSGNCNDYRVGGYCRNSNMKDIANGRPNARCDKSSGPKISIQCLNNTEKDSVSCDAGNYKCENISWSAQKNV